MTTNFDTKIQQLLTEMPHIDTSDNHKFRLTCDLELEKLPVKSYREVVNRHVDAVEFVIADSAEHPLMRSILMREKKTASEFKRDVCNVLSDRH